MEFNEKDLLLIENYLDGKLSIDENEAFENRLLSDEDFQKTFEFRKKMPELMVQSSEYEKTRAQVKEALRPEKKHFFVSNRSWIYAAAVLLVLVGLIAIIRFATNNESKLDGQMVKESDTETLKIDQPTNFAKSAQVNKHIEILEPVDFKFFDAEESIDFSWKSDSTGPAVIFIKSIDENKIKFEKSISLENQKFKLEEIVLPEGSYTWFINDTISIGSFVIKNR